jgi:hypothetical protein
VKISITAPTKKREAVGVGAKGEGNEGGSLPDAPEVLPEVPDAPPAEEPPTGEGETSDEG